MDSCINVEFNPVRVSFGGQAVWTRDVLNLGASPARMVALMRTKLEAARGQVYERTGLKGMTVHPNGVVLTIQDPGSAPNTITARLVVDCMGHFSPVVSQQRWGRKPDGVCLVVGTLASGFKDNTTADVIATTTPIQPDDAPVNK